MVKQLLLGLIISLPLSVSASYNQNYYSKVIVKTNNGNEEEGSVSVNTNDNSDQYGGEIFATNMSNQSDDNWLAWIAPASDTHTYYLFEKPNIGYEFDCWEITSGNSNAEIVGNIIQVQAQKSSSASKPTEVIVVGKFKKRSQPIIAKSSNEQIGTVTISGNNSWDSGSVILKAEKAWSTGLTALNGYRCANAVKFIGWFDNNTGDCLSTETEYSIDNITEEMNIVGQFELRQSINKDNYNGGYFRARYYSCENDYLTINADYGPSLASAPFSWVSLDDYISFSLNHSDPANILQFTGSMTSNSDNNFQYEKEKSILERVNLIGQGTSTNGVTGQYFTINHTAQPGLVKFTYNFLTTTLVLKATEHSKQSPSSPFNGHGNGGVPLEFGVGADHAGEAPDYQSYFELEPIDEEHIDEFYFGAEPSSDLFFNDGYWTTMYTSFPYKCWEDDGVEAYYIKEFWEEGKDLGLEPAAMLEKIEDGIVPAKTAVLLKCKSTEPSQNRLLPLTDDQPNYYTDNLLKGSFQLNSKSVAKTTFSSSSMKVLSVVDGEVGFYNLEEGKELTANKAWLDISGLGSNASKIKLKVGDTATFVEGISVNTPEEDANAPIYNLQGIQVKNLVPGQIYIKNGKKFIAR